MGQAVFHILGPIAIKRYDIHVEDGHNVFRHAMNVPLANVEWIPCDLPCIYRAFTPEIGFLGARSKWARPRSGLPIG